jgi:large conductance mechanosensitive channel
LLTEAEVVMAEQRKGLGAQFKEFITRGNVVDLAVAVVLGTAFAALVASLVDDLLMPIVAAVIGEPDFSDLTFKINDSVFAYGAFLTALVTFLSIAAAVFFFVVKPLNMLMERRKRAMAAGAEPAPETLSDEAVILTEIRDLLRSQRGIVG